MKSKQASREKPVSVPLPFEEAIRRALQVKPPPEGWTEDDRRERQRRKRKLPEHAKES
jgi:hypothetical protein